MVEDNEVNSRRDVLAFITAVAISTVSLLAILYPFNALGSSDLAGGGGQLELNEIGTNSSEMKNMNSKTFFLIAYKNWSAEWNNVSLDDKILKCDVFNDNPDTFFTDISPVTELPETVSQSLYREKITDYFVTHCSTVNQFRDSTSLDGRQKSVIVFI